MSSYFDNAQRLATKSYADLLTAEEQVYRDVTYITGDIEFPEDLREKIMGTLAVNFAWQPGDLTPPLHAVEQASTCGYSSGIEAVHGLFHELAERRVKARFGVLSDKPTLMSRLRDEHDADPRD